MSRRAPKMSIFASRCERCHRPRRHDDHKTSKSRFDADGAVRPRACRMSCEVLTTARHRLCSFSPAEQVFL